MSVSLNHALGEIRNEVRVGASGRAGGMSRLRAELTLRPKAFTLPYIDANCLAAGLHVPGRHEFI